MVMERGAGPAISVVVPVLNEGERLEACLDALAGQTLPASDFEVLVVDGGSNDGTRERVLEHGFRFIEDGAGGVSGARNLGVSAARGDIIAFTDGDCIPDPDWLERVLAWYAIAGPDVGGVGGGLRMVELGTALSRFEQWSTHAYYRGFITSNATYRRSVMLEVGGFDTNLPCGEDWDLCWRVKDHGYHVLYAPDAVVTHAPTELEGWLTFARRQFWYARRDVRMNLKRVRAVLRGESAPVTTRDFLRVMGPSFAPAVAVGAACLAPAHPRRALTVAGLLLGGQAVVRAVEARRRVPAVRAFPLAAFFVLKYAVRGAGSLVGLVEEFDAGSREAGAMDAAAPGWAVQRNAFTASPEPVAVVTEVAIAPSAG